MKKWEYLSHYDCDPETMNAFGGSGWELVSVVLQWSDSSFDSGAQPRKCVYYFKRELIEGF